jgi:hypothetical protein
MLDPNSASMFGMQSSQGSQGAFQEPKRGDANENLAYYLAMMASGNPGAQGASLVQSGGQDTSGGGLGGGGWSMPSQTGNALQETLGGVQSGIGAINTGQQLYGAGSSLYNALFNTPTAPAISQTISDVPDAWTGLFTGQTPEYANWLDTIGNSLW